MGNGQRVSVQRIVGTVVGLLTICAIVWTASGVLSTLAGEVKSTSADQAANATADQVRDEKRAKHCAAIDGRLDRLAESEQTLAGQVGKHVEKPAHPRSEQDMNTVQKSQADLAAAVGTFNGEVKTINAKIDGLTGAIATEKTNRDRQLEDLKQFIRSEVRLR